MYDINDLTKNYFYLCNFYMRPMTFNGLNYSNAEAAYQAQKCLYDEDKMLFVEGGDFSSPREAQKRGQQIAIVDNWDDKRVEVMYEVIAEKFLQNPDLAERLIQTNGQLITEGDRFSDTFWGLTEDGGENHLGNILMYIRDNVLTHDRRLIRSKMDTIQEELAQLAEDRLSDFLIPFYEKIYQKKPTMADIEEYADKASLMIVHNIGDLTLTQCRAAQEAWNCYAALSLLGSPDGRGGKFRPTDSIQSLVSASWIYADALDLLYGCAADEYGDLKENG